MAYAGVRETKNNKNSRTKKWKQKSKSIFQTEKNKQDTTKEPKHVVSTL